MDNLLFELQNESKEASLFLVHENTDFISEYFELLTEDNYIVTENTLQFLELFGEATVEDSIKQLKELLETFNKEEIYNELIAIFLGLAKRCEPNEDFEIFLKVIFKYELYNRLLENNPEYFKKNCPPEYEMIFDDNDIDDFYDKRELSSLTILQRIILKLIFVDEMSIYSVSEFLHIEDTDCEECYNNAIEILSDF